MARRELRDDEVIRVGDVMQLNGDSGTYCEGSPAIGVTVRRRRLALHGFYRVFRDEPDEPAGDPGTIDLPAGTVIEAGDQYWCPHTKAWVASSVCNFGKRIGDPGTRAYDTGEPFRYRRRLPKPRFLPIVKADRLRVEFEKAEPAPKKGDPVAWAPPTREELENARRELSKPTPTVPPYSTSAPCVICGRTDADLVFVANRAVKVCPTHTRLERVKAGLEEDPYRGHADADSEGRIDSLDHFDGPSQDILENVKDLSRPPLTILGPDASGDDIAADAESPYWRKK